MKHITPTVALMSLLSLGACNKTGKIEYPAAPADSTVYEVFGMKVADTYRPLENDTAAATAAWVEAENRVTSDYLSKIPFRNALRDRLTELNRYQKNGLPWKGKDGHFYFFRNDGLSNQSVLYRASDAEGTDAEVFIDPNKLSEDGTVALTGVFESHDGRYMAYTISRSGSDWTEIFVVETATGRLLDDHIEWAKFTGAAWQGDGFYYSAYDRPEAGKEYSSANEYHKVYYHKLGTPQSADKIAYENRNEPLHFHTAEVADDESLLMIMGGGQGHGNSLYVKDLRKAGAPWTTIEESQDLTMEPVKAFDGKMYVYTSVDAPRYRLVEIDPKRPGRTHWREVVAQPDSAVFTGADFADDKIIARFDKDASNRAWIYGLDGKREREIEFPTYGTAGFSAERGNDDVFYSFSSFTYPSAIYRYNLATGESTPFKSSAIKNFNSADYVTEQVFYPSADGTKIPMFVTRHKDVEPDGTNPVYLYGYGGFNVPLNPTFSPNRLLWLENGGIYAQANLRGGSEYGEEWHEAGTKMNKLNVFNDFIAAAEYLVEQGWTKPELLTIEGGSNGGLLVGACVNMRPDLFRVAIPRVGVMDMMRYHLFTIGWNWAHDYGTADDSPEMAKYLLEYSPLHNISNDGTPYPAIMVTTADHDDRVVPAHSFKYAAALQASDTGDRPKLIRIDSKAGHGAGKPVSKVIDEYADIYSFIFHNLGLTPDGPKAEKETE